MKKHFIKSIISVLTVIVMTAVFLPIGEIKAAEDFNVYVYMADNILSEEKPANSIYWYYVKNPNRYKSMAEIWYESFSSDKDFMDSVAAWETVNLALEPGDVYSKSIEAKGYYMTVLLSMLKCNSDTVINQLSSMSEVKAVSKNYQSFVKLFKELYSSYEEDDLNALLELHKDFYTPEEVDMLRNVQKEWFKQNYDESVLGGLSNAFDNYMTLYDSAQTVTELVNQFTSFCMVSQISDEWKDCIIYMYNNCGGCAVPLKAALEDMYNVVISDNWNVAALSVVAKNAINTTGAEMFSTCVDFLIDEFIGNCPLVKGMDIGKAVGTSISNMLFATDKTIEQFYIISAYCKIFDLFLKSFQNVETRYLNNRTPENAKSFLRYVDMFYETFELGNSFGQDFTEVLYKGGIANVLFRSQEQYAEFTDYRKIFSNAAKQSHNTIQTLWLNDLYYDDPDMYAVYAEIFADKLNFISVTGVEFEKESVEWGLEDAVYLGYDCNVIPGNADCREILYSSSNENIAEIDSQGMLIVRSEGSCIITAAALENTDITDTLLVTVVEGNGKDGLPYIEITPITPTPDEVDFEYTIDDGKVIVTKYIGDDADVIIPDTIEGCPVTSIASYAFEDCTSLKNINIPNSVTSIGSYAFDTCTSLASITIPNSVVYIGDYAFSGCENLSDLTIPDSVISMGAWSFSYYNKLKTVRLPKCITSIGSNAFEYCRSLTVITIPESVTSIGDGAFSSCTSLISITIPDNVTSIGSSAFSSCTSLTSITISDNVSSIGSSAFRNCTSLTSITIPDSVTSIGDSVFSGCTSLTSIKMSESITSIDSRAFYGCTSFENITIPESVTSIGNWAFSGCTRLKNITIPNNVQRIGFYAFYECENLQVINVSGDNNVIKDGAFGDCTNLKTVNILKGVKSIENSVFSNCTNIETVTIQNGLISIGGCVFDDCEKLTSIILPDSTTQVGDWTFNINTIVIASQKCKFGKLTDKYLNVYKYDSDNNTAYVWAVRADITEVDIPKFVNGYKITSIYDSAFSECTELTTVKIPNSITSIGYHAFYNCTSLANIIIPDSVISIGDRAFEKCTSLTYVEIPPSVLYADSPFYSCENLKRVVLKDGINIICENFFRYCTSLESVTIPDSVTSIGSYAFYNCTSLESITIPDSVTSIGTDTFKNCPNLTIYGYSGSYAETYAKDKDIPFVALDAQVLKPTITKAIAGDSKVALNWTAVDGAEKYAIYTYLGGKYTCIGGRAASVTGMYVTGLTNGTKYGFLVRAYINGAWSSFTADDIVYATPVGAAKPTITKAIAGDSKVALNWTAVDGAEKYAIYTYLNGKYTCIGGRASNVTGMYVTGLTNGTKYGFLVRAYINGAWSSFTSADIVYATPVGEAKPKITKAIAGDSKVALNWTAVNGAEKYAIYTYVNGKYTCVGSRASTVTGMYVTGLTNGTKYGFLVRAYINGAWSSFKADDIVYATPVGAAKPTITKAIAGDGKVALNWTAVSGAEKYAIYTYVNGKYTCVGSRASTVTGMYVTGLTNGTKYGFLVRAYINGAWSSFTTADIVYATPTATAAASDISLDETHYSAPVII